MRSKQCLPCIMGCHDSSDRPRARIPAHTRRAFPRIQDLCRCLGRQISARFQVNAYLTPRSSQGFATHCDTHDVFVLQIAGTKRWSVFDAEVALPCGNRPGPWMYPESHSSSRNCVPAICCISPVVFRITQ
ncbi:JmjC domain-containing protein [Nocardia sp. NPDC057440]|uniref:JmjC domain-containing protein n=1 Tax=Nocardia sp. NPDC057440 TaxID=3346134 RepID=UPI00366F0C10